MLLVGTWGHTALIPALGMKRQAIHVSSKPAWYTKQGRPGLLQKPCLTKQKQTNQKRKRKKMLVTLPGGPKFSSHAHVDFGKLTITL